MAPKSSKTGNSKKGMGKKAKRVMPAQKQPVPDPAVGTAVDGEDTGSTSSSSFFPDQEVIGTFEENGGGAEHFRPRYPSLEIEDEEEDARERLGYPRTPPMMPWKVHPSKEDTEKLRKSPVDLQQRQVLQGLSEDALSHIEMLDAQSNTSTTSTSLEKLHSVKHRVPWRWDGQYQAMSFLDISKVGGPNPYRCRNGDCATEVVLFANPAALRKHLRAHIPKGMRPYVCEGCPPGRVRKDFNYPKDLERHFIKVHQIEELEVKAHLKPTKCVVCGESFSRPDGLKRHTKTFNGSCIGSKRLRRKSAPAKNMLADQSFSPALTAESSVLSDLTGTSAFTADGRPMTSSATSASAQDFELEDNFNIDPMLYQYQPSPFQ